ncbi:hypothetical protein MASR1M97_27270 [Candidatus Desulfobacillus denitrificans]
MRIVSISLISLSLLAPGADAQTMYRWVDKDGKVHYSDQPPPKEIKKVDQPKLGVTSSIETSGQPFDVQQAAQNFPVMLYTTPECVSECAVARDLLKRRGVPFREGSVVTTNDADIFRKTLGTDKLQFPALTVGKSKQIGFEEETWHGLLDAAGYPRGTATGTTGGQPAGAPPAR